ncbi:glycosyltransferase family 2 protein [candidate division KSB1 bacterium]|nr:glycosyltransferase family 2 protein [candidate division KSB1 bacterium]
MLLSIIIVNFNALELLKKCLESIQQNTRLSPEIILIDNHSTDGSVEFIRKHYPEIRFIENHANVGFSRANNQGLKFCQGDYILFLNNDTEILPHSLEKLVQFLEANPQVGAVGPMLLYPDGSFQYSTGRFPSIWNEWKTRQIMEKLDRGDIHFRHKFASQFQHQQAVDWITGACILTRAKLVMELGGFDEKMFMFFEDVDLCKRIQKAGCRIVYFPDAKVIHHQGVTYKAKKNTTKAIYRQSQKYYYTKHNSWLANVGLFFYLKYRHDQ